MISRSPNISFEGEKSETVGSITYNSIGSQELPNFDPFVLLDEYTGKAPAGFPDHPHRGFEAVGYILKGEVRHENIFNDKGSIQAGGMQWVTAGRGIVHSEMLGEEETWGLQLWVNLKKADKMIKPQCQELSDENISKGEQNGVSVKVIAGESFGIKSSIYTRTSTHYLDFKMAPGSNLDQLVPKDWNAFVYVLSGEAVFGPEGNEKLCQIHQIMTFNQDGISIRAQNKGSSECHFIMVSGEIIGEPIVQQGPFVMTTEDEIRQAETDYKLSQNGFENAHTWSSGN